MAKRAAYTLMKEGASTAISSSGARASSRLIVHTCSRNVEPIHCTEFHALARGLILHSNTVYPPRFSADTSHGSPDTPNTDNPSLGFMCGATVLTKSKYVVICAGQNKLDNHCATISWMSRGQSGPSIGLSETFSLVFALALAFLVPVRVISTCPFASMDIIRRA